MEIGKDFLSLIEQFLNNVVIFDCMSKIKEPQKLIVFGVCIWWAHTDLNCGPTDYESAALTN